MQPNICKTSAAERRECAKAYMESHISDFRARLPACCQNLGREMQAGSGRRYGTAVLREHSLVTLAIAGRRPAVDIGWQRSLPDLFEQFFNWSR